MNQLGLGKLVTVSSLLLFLAACGMDGNTPQTNQPPTVTLDASPKSGPAPLSVTLSATATDPEGDTLSYKWSLEGAATTPTITYGFARAGTYPVTVMVSDGQNTVNASTSVTVSDETSTPPTNPPTDPNPPMNPPTNPPIEPEPTKPTIKVTASLGGPVPWAVRYDVSTTGYPKGSKITLICQDGVFFAYPIGNDSFTCLHTKANEEVSVKVYPSSTSGPNSEIAEKTFAADVEASTGIPFEGTWRYTEAVSGETGTFTITKIGETGREGSDDTNTHRIFYYVEDDDGVVEFSWPNGTAEILERPLKDGTQYYIPRGKLGAQITLEKIR